VVKAMKTANAMKAKAAKAKAADEDTQSVDEESDDDDDDEGSESDEGSVTPPAEVLRRPSAAVAKRPSGADQHSRLPSLPPPPSPYLGWYCSTWDPDLFDAQVPHLDDLIMVTVRDSSGKDSSGILARVEFMDPIDIDGAAIVLRYVEGEENYLTSWARNFMRGADDPKTGVVHFCRHERCNYAVTDKNVVHSVRWKLMPPSPPTSDKPISGIPLFGGPRSPQMDAVDEARRSAGYGSGRTDQPRGALPPDRTARGSKAVVLPPRALGPPLAPPSVTDERADHHKELPSDARPKKVSMDEALRRRAAKSRPLAPGATEEWGDDECDERSKRKKRHRRRGDSRSGSESSSAPVFRGAPTIFKGSKFLQAAVKREGALLENGVQTMRKALAARQGGGVLSSEMTEQLSQLQGVVTNYLTVGLAPSAASQGKPLGIRNEREMRTLAEGIDAILAGDLGRAGDILMQRFRACEVNVLEGDWSLARHLELIPQHQISSVPAGMRQEMIREQNLANKLISGSALGKRKSDERSGG